MNRKRNPKKANLSNLTVVDSYSAYNGKKIKKGVYGIVSRDHSIIYKNVVDRKSNQLKPKYVNDIYSLTNVAKEKIVAFFDNKQNKNKHKCYLIDKDYL